MRNTTLAICCALMLAPVSLALAADAGKAEVEKATDASVKAAPAKADAGTATPVVKPKAPETPEEALGLVKQVIQAVKAGKWAWAIGLVLMILVFVLNKVLGDKIPSAILPWASIGLGVIASVSFALATGSPWLDAVFLGLSQGLAASGGYSAIGKYFLKPKDEGKEPTPA